MVQETQLTYYMSMWGLSQLTRLFAFQDSSWQWWLWVW